MFTYRGRTVTGKDIVFIKALIVENPDDSRRALSQRLCRAWNWVQPNGVLRDMVCRGLMLELHRTGYIRLPAKKCHPQNPFVRRKKPAKSEIDKTPVRGKLSHIRPLEFRQVRRDCCEKLFNSLIEHYHYLETFVDKTRFAGTCYKAANWIYLGDTTGRGKNDHTYKANRSIKAVWGYPLTKDFRTALCGGTY